MARRISCSTLARSPGSSTLLRPPSLCLWQGQNRNPGNFARVRTPSRLRLTCCWLAYSNRSTHPSLPPRWTPNDIRITPVVLVADDEPSMLALVAQHIKTMGYRVLEASDGEQAWSLAQEHFPIS